MASEVRFLIESSVHCSPNPSTEATPPLTNPNINSKMNEQLLTPKDVMERFSISRTSLEALIRNGHLDPVKINSRVYRYKASQVDALADKLECQLSGAE
jgi:hypothetical protein